MPTLHRLWNDGRSLAAAALYLRKAELGPKVRLQGRPKVHVSGRMIIGDRARIVSTPATLELAAIDGGTLVPVASLPGCQGGYPGVFDMSGNVEEVEDSCDDAGTCYSRGGSFVDDPALAETRCDNLSQRVMAGHHHINHAVC